MPLPKQFTRHVNKAHNSYRRQLMSIERAVHAGRSTKRLRREFLGCPDTRFSAASKVLGKLSEQTYEETLALASELRPWEERASQVEYHLKQKPGGGYRPICELPLHLFAQHKFVSHAIRAQMRVHANLFGISPPLSKELRPLMPTNTGREGAVWAIQEMMRSGFHYLVEVDIRDCFQSFHPEAIHQLPLPEDVIRNVLDTRNIEFLPRNTSQTSQPETTSGDQQEQLPEQQLVQRDHIMGIPGGVTVDNPYGPRGLMQGSPVSSIVLAYFLNQVLFELDGDDEAKCVICFDNIVVAASTEAGLRRMTYALAECLRQCCAGPFELSEPTGLGSEGFRYMGYILDADGMSIHVDPDRISKLEKRLAHLENALHYPTNPIRSLKAIRDYHAGYSAVSDPYEEFDLYVDHTLNGYDDYPNLLTALASSLFAPKGTVDRELVNGLLGRYA